MSFLSWLRRRTNEDRARDLDNISEILWRRHSTSRFDRLHVSFEDGHWLVHREDTPGTRGFETYRGAESYVRKFYRGLIDGSGAPDDIFLDSLGAVTKGKGKA
jgi:hypothetical protein